MCFTDNGIGGESDHDCSLHPQSPTPSPHHSVGRPTSSDNVNDYGTDNINNNNNVNISKCPITRSLTESDCRMVCEPNSEPNDDQDNKCLNLSKRSMSLLNSKQNVELGLEYQPTADINNESDHENRNNIDSGKVHVKVLRNIESAPLKQQSHLFSDKQQLHQKELTDNQPQPTKSSPSPCPAPSLSPTLSNSTQNCSSPNPSHSTCGDVPGKKEEDTKEDSSQPHKVRYL